MSSYLVPRLIVFNYGIINNASHLPLLQLRVLIKAHTHPRIWKIYYLKCLSVILGKIATMWQITQWFNISLCVSNSFFGKQYLPPMPMEEKFGCPPPQEVIRSSYLPQNCWYFYTSHCHTKFRKEAIWPLRIFPNCREWNWLHNGCRFQSSRHQNSLSLHTTEN